MTPPECCSISPSSYFINQQSTIDNHQSTSASIDQKGPANLLSFFLQIRNAPYSVGTTD
jgi:hypothetical protein